jgi:hypothetical protein
MSSRADDQICAFENRVRRPSRSDWCRDPLGRPNTWGGRLADYLDRRHHAEQIKHLGRRPLGLLRVMIFTPNQVKLRSARSGNNKLTKTNTKVYICRPTTPKASNSLYLRLGCPSHRRVWSVVDALGWPPSRSGTDSRVRARAQFDDGSRNAITPHDR